jgi:hypothetical protein
MNGIGRTLSTVTALFKTEKSKQLPSHRLISNSFENNVLRKSHVHQHQESQERVKFLIEQEEISPASEHFGLSTDSEMRKEIPRLTESLFEITWVVQKYLYMLWLDTLEQGFDPIPKGRLVSEPNRVFEPRR